MHAQTHSIILGAICAGVRCSTSRRTHRSKAPGTSAREGKGKGEALDQTDAFPILYEQVHEFSRCQVLTMILPQVHLRKPCYDFSFL